MCEVSAILLCSTSPLVEGEEGIFCLRGGGWVDFNREHCHAPLPTSFTLINSLVCSVHSSCSSEDGSDVIVRYPLEGMKELHSTSGCD